MKKLTTEEFIKKARVVHGGWYDYSKVDYVTNRIAVIVICPDHGEFKIRPDNHLTGRGCQQCYHKSTRSTTPEWIKKAIKVHGTKYDYSKVDYINSYTNVTIICPDHGEFTQLAKDHLIGRGCQQCAGNLKMTRETFTMKAIKVHGTKYDYSKVDYINNYTNVTIICHDHGEFKITPGNHLNGRGCQQCSQQLVGYWGLKTPEERQAVQPGYVYHLRLNELSIDGQSFDKIGISYKPAKRINSIYKDSECDLLGGRVITVKDMDVAFNMEKSIHAKHHPILYKPRISFKGSIKECFEPFGDPLKPGRQSKFLPDHCNMDLLADAA